MACREPSVLHVRISKRQSQDDTQIIGYGFLLYVILSSFVLSDSLITSILLLPRKDPIPSDEC